MAEDGNPPLQPEGEESPSPTQDSAHTRSFPARPPPPRPGSKSPPQQDDASHPPAHTAAKEPNKSAAPAPAPAGAVSSGPPAPETPQEKKAKEFIAQAEKKIKSSQSFFGGLFGLVKMFLLQSELPSDKLGYMYETERDTVLE